MQYTRDGINWIRENIEGSPTTIEAIGPSYRSLGSRVAIYTGLPTVSGWEFHQAQQRAEVPGTVGQRARRREGVLHDEDVQRARELIRKYDVEWVIVGDEEQFNYPETGLKKFENGLDGALELAYQNPGMQIWHVIPESELAVGGTLSAAAGPTSRPGSRRLPDTMQRLCSKPSPTSCPASSRSSARTARSPRRTSTRRCARCASRCSRRTSTSRSCASSSPTVRERALGAEVLKSLTGPQQVIAIVNEELVNILGGSQSTLQLASKPPTVIMLVGLKGSGKTTTAAKLALHLRKQRREAAARGGGPVPHGRGRAAQGARRSSSACRCSRRRRGRSCPTSARRRSTEAKRQSATVVIVDTAGRSTIDGELMTEVTQMRAALNPHETILVLDAMTGQEAVNVAQEFHDQLNVTGIIVSKMDGDARGGAVLSIRAVTGLPVKFIGTGEKADALEPFYPDRFASRILGMGDMLRLIERAKDAISEQDVQAIEKKMKTKRWTWRTS